jgi:hypothetical protein
MRRVLKTLIHRSGRRRVLIVERATGRFGYEEEELKSVYDDELAKRVGQRAAWFALPQNPLTICNSPEDADREARGNVDWLSER